MEEVIPEAEEDDGKEEVGNELPEEAEEEEEDQPEYIKALMEMGVPIPEKEVDFEDVLKIHRIFFRKIAPFMKNENRP